MLEKWDAEELKLVDDKAIELHNIETWGGLLNFEKLL